MTAYAVRTVPLAIAGAQAAVAVAGFDAPARKPVAAFPPGVGAGRMLILFRYR